MKYTVGKLVSLSILVLVLVLAACTATAQSSRIGEYILADYRALNASDTFCETVINRVDFDMGGMIGSMWIPGEKEIIEAVINSPQMKDMQLVGMTGKIVQYDADPSNKEMIADIAWIESVPGGVSDWNAFDAGERAGQALNALNAAGNFLADNGRAPVDSAIYDALTARCGRSLNIIGLDSAYIGGTSTLNTGNPAQWEAWPFFVVDHDNTLFENKCYVYFRLAVPSEDGFTEMMEYFISDRASVAEIFGHMLNLNPEISDEDRQMMANFSEFFGNGSAGVSETEESARGAAPMVEDMFSLINGQRNEIMSTSELVNFVTGTNFYFRRSTCEASTINNNVVTLVWNRVNYSFTAESIESMFFQSLNEMRNISEIACDGYRSAPINMDTFSRHVGSEQGCFVNMFTGAYLYGKEDDGTEWDICPFILTDRKGGETPVDDTLYIYVRIAESNGNGTDQYTEMCIADRDIAARAVVSLLNAASGVSEKDRSLLTRLAGL